MPTPNGVPLILLYCTSSKCMGRGLWYKVTRHSKFKCRVCDAQLLSVELVRLMLVARSLGADEEGLRLLLVDHKVTETRWAKLRQPV